MVRREGADGLGKPGASAYWRHFHLERDPFAVVNGSEHYLGPQRRQLLATLQQQLIKGVAVQLVCACEGMGKTTLCQQLLANTAEDFFVCQIDGEQVSSAHKLFAKMAACYGLNLAVTEPASFVQGLQAQLGALREQRQALLLVDNAQLLDDDTLELLLHLATLADEQGGMLRLVLFSEPQISKRLSAPRFAALPKAERIDLEGLGGEEIGAYLLHRLQVVGYAGTIPFREGELRQIAMASHGNPAAINSHARLLLQEKNRPGPFVLIRHPVSLFLSAGVVLAIVLGSVMWREAGEGPSQTLACVEGDVVTPTDAALPPCTESVGQALALPAPEGEAEPSGREPQAQPETRPLPSAVAASSHPSSTMAVPASDVIQDAAWLTAQPADHFTVQLMVSKERANLHRLAQQVNLSGPLAEFVTQRDGSLLYVLTLGSYAERGEAEQVSGALPEAIAGWVRTMGSVQQAMYTGSVQPVQENAGGDQTGGVTGQLRDVAWIWSQNPAHYTLQVAAGSSGQAVRARVEGIDWPGKRTVIRVQRDKKEWYIAVLGSFESVEAARQAMAGLPAALQRNQPWPRDFASLQDEISRATP